MMTRWVFVADFQFETNVIQSIVWNELYVEVAVRESNNLPGLTSLETIRNI